MNATHDMGLILALGLLLAVGFACARLVKRLHLPSVTGYLLAGVALGPSGFGVIPEDLLATRLQHFTEMALMLVAFAVGERFDVRQLARSARALGRVSSGEITGAFVFSALALLAASWATGAGGQAAGWALWAAAALVCAAIAVATGPAATLAVFREIQASGPVSRLVISSVVVNNAISVTLFGVCVAVAHSLLGTTSGSELRQVAQAILYTVEALALGVAVGLGTDLVVHRLLRRSDILVVALTAVLLCGGLASYLGLSPLLTGLAAGFAMVNRDRRDVRAFRALNDFDPPLYGIFFALAGAQLHWDELVASGAIGGAFVLARAAGKWAGAWAGATAAQAPQKHARAIGLGLLPQADLAIGLAYLVRQDPALEPIWAIVINVVVASVVVNEVVGPPLVRFTLIRAGEAGRDLRPAASAAPGEDAQHAPVVPWTWPKLQPAPRPEGYALACLGHPATAAGVTRIATLLAHHYRALPLAVHVLDQEQDNEFWGPGPDRHTVRLFRIARREAQSLGYDMSTEVEFAADVAEGILRVADTQNAQAIVLGHPFARQATRFARIVDAVAAESACPVVVVRFVGALHTERILAPICDDADMRVVEPVLKALAGIQEHQLTLLNLTHPEASDAEFTECEAALTDWARDASIPGAVACRVIAAESRVHEIVQAAEDHDIIVMAATGRQGLRRAFFGSLAEDVAQRSPRSMLLVRAGMEANLLQSAPD